MNDSVFARHALVVVAAASTAVTLFAIGHYALGVDVEAPSADPLRVTVGSVLGTSSIAAALGWALLSALESWRADGRALWTRIAVGVTLVSLLGPLTTSGITGSGRVLLCLLHLAVGAVTIGVLTSTSHRPTCAACGNGAYQPVS